MGIVIPSFHFDNPDTKLTNEWFRQAIQYYWFNANNRFLLEGKNLKEIEEFATGAIDMAPFLRMFKSYAKKLDPNVRQKVPPTFDGVDNPLPLIPEKLNAAIAIVQKTEVEVSCTANDALAMQKKKEDLDFLVSKPQIEAELQPFFSKLRAGKADIGTTKNSSVEFSDNPFGLDLQDPQQRDIFTKLMYSLRVETSFEKALQQFYDLKKVEQVRLLETIDQYWYGVSAHTAYRSSITGLPDIDYTFPGDIKTQKSELPDFGDNEARFKPTTMKVMEMFNMFKDDIVSMERLTEILLAKDTGYFYKRGEKGISEKNFDTQNVNLVLCEIKSLDYIGVYKNKTTKNRKGFKTLTDDPTKATEKIWGQNTYQCWWLEGTDYFFAKDKLGFAYRTRGQESYQNFSTNIYRSQKRSAVELSIAENKVAQMAYIKLVYSIVMSKPAGAVFDLRGIRAAAESLVKEEGAPTQLQLIEAAVERNQVLIDTQGFEGKDNQHKPYFPIPGGLQTEVNGYWQTISQCAANISRFTGINDNLTGQQSEELIGLQESRINSSINAIHYVTEAIETQYQALFNNWANHIQYAIEDGGKTKQAIINYIGVEDVNVLDGLNEVPLHNLTIKIGLVKREKENMDYKARVAFLRNQGVISATDEMLLDLIKNPKERIRLLAAREAMWKKEQKAIREEEQKLMLDRQQMVNDGLVGKENAKVDGAIKQIYSKGEVDAKIEQLRAEQKQMLLETDYVGKKALQQDRGQDQLNKSVATIEKKNEVELQKPLAII